MTCHNCEIHAGRHGKNRNGTQRYRCGQCGRTFSEERQGPFGDMRIAEERGLMALSLLVEGCSVRSVSRLTGLEKRTVLSLLLVAGEKCRRFMDDKIRGVSCEQVQADEIWTYVGKKQKRLAEGDPEEYGDQYVFVAIDPETKLALSHRVGKRTGRTAHAFLSDLASRLAGRVQLSTDFFRPYWEGVQDVFGADVDYAVVVKLYGGEAEAGREAYAPSRCLGTQKIILEGDPEESLICTSHIERQNLTMRMSIRRFGRLTNAFSKRLRHLKAAVALHFCHYNFCRVHSSIDVTPAMEAGIADTILEMGEILREV